MFELSAGQIVADKYRVDGVMGTGGMGVVVAATHVELDQKVAIKFLREVSTEALARFQREARLLVRLKSPHVARVFDVGAMDDDTPYIVMEHLDGSDLASVVTARSKLPVEETVDYILQACEAVAEAHALGMVHRDLKPANLFLARGPGGTTTVKVLDFGVSKILDDRATGSDAPPRGGDLTNEGVALGSPGYMSPEQMTSSRDVDERSDIFSLGALLYRLVGGQTPYKGTAVVSILATMATEGLKPLRSLTPDAPELFSIIVERCLAQDKAARYPTVAHLAHALLPYATRRGRVIVEQILATLNVTFEEELGNTVVRPVQAPPRPDSTRPVRSLPSMPQLAPAFVQAQPAAPQAKPISRQLTIGITLGLLVVLAGMATWTAVRSPARSTNDTDPAVSNVTTAVPVPVIAPVVSPAVVVEPPIVPNPQVPAADPAPPRPRGTGFARPKSHGAPHGPAGPSPPPNAADVPGGRR